MAICPRCGKRLAKRACPAFGHAICQLCCGTLREKEISCPPSCVHLSAHKLYQDKRALEKTSPDSGRARNARGARPRDERLGWLVLHIEAALHQHTGTRPDFKDADAVVALEYAREKAEKEATRLIIPGAPLKAVNEAGELVFRTVEECRYQPTAILESGAETYKRDEKTGAMEQVAREIKSFFKADPSGRAYLEDLNRRFDQAGARSRGQKLITLT